MMKNHSYSEDIMSVILEKNDKPMSYPIITVDSQHKLRLQFDDLSTKTRQFNYTLIHCTPDWKPSDLMASEYLEGFREGEITDYEFSFNTLKEYNHYSLKFPTDDCLPYLSGNYIIFVYENYDKEQPVLTRRFRISENSAKISASLKRSSLVVHSDYCTEFDVSVNGLRSTIGSDTRGCRLQILRNNNDDFVLDVDEPDFVKGNLLEYSSPRHMFLKSGNEYRYFNVKNHKYTTDKVANIRFTSPYYIFKLYPEEPAAYTYSYVQDINGKFLVTSDDTDYPATEAEYVLVDFELKVDRPYMGHDLYLYGDFCESDFSERDRLSYNTDSKSYELRRLLKQGFYNYMYVLRNVKNNVLTLENTERNFYQTENDFVIYFYYKRPAGNYTQLLGVKIVNSQKKL
ncbi:MAG: DUF5103 domain-containing protein [Bacteroidota bacterium]|nr:DUF5103 domain-containing protein [Bacteroidota bacterium]